MGDDRQQGSVLGCILVFVVEIVVDHAPEHDHDLSRCTCLHQARRPSDEREPLQRRQSSAAKCSGEGVERGSAERVAVEIEHS